MTDQSKGTGMPEGAEAGPDERHRQGVGVVGDFYRALEDKDIDAFAKLWTADAVYRVPVTADGVPGEFAGRESVVAGLGHLFSLSGATRITWDAEPMGDPRKVLATWTLEIELLAGGTYRNRGVSIFRLEGERIAELSEHMDTAAFLGAFATKVETARRFLELMRAKDVDAFGELWHERAVISILYPPDGFSPLIEGKEKIVASYRKLLPIYETLDIEVTGVHPAVDSDAICVEYKVRAKVINGTAYSNDNMMVFRFEDGLISACHDYFDPRRVKELIEGLPAGTT